jgi:hypothetical protein
MLSKPLRVPVDVGVKVTVILQDAPGATGAEHMLVAAKSPVAEAPVTLRAALPTLVTMTV